MYATKTDLKIGSINIETADVFNLKNPKENKILHRFANKVHIKTKISVIQNQLLFHTGNPFNLESLAQMERLLRENKYIKEASVYPVELCGDRVNIMVKTRDNWTFTPGVTFSRAGGNNRSGIEVQEHNLFGYGKSLSFKYKKGSERNSKLFYYKDPQLFGSHKKLSIILQDNSDGEGYDFNLNLPFYKLDSKRSWGIKTSKLKEDTPIYNAGDITKKITKEITNHTVFVGGLRKTKGNSVSRFKVGWTFDKSDYLQSSNDELFSPVTTVESYPWIEFESQHENYIEKTNFKTMGKIEDISLGRSLKLGAGFLLKEFGSDDNHLKLAMSYSDGYEIGKSNLGFISFQASSYLGKGFRQGESVLIKGELNHFNKKGNDLFFSGTIQAANNLKLTEQLHLGGKAGFRGYPKAYQAGSKSIVFQAEKRFHFDWYPLHLAKFGAVLFSEVGTVWGQETEAKILADVGIGFRIVPTRSSLDKTIHVDLGFPLVDRGNVDKFQFSIKTSQLF